MNQEELNKRQEAIAVFMGGEYLEITEGFFIWCFEIGHSKNLLYHKRMNNLYPVCQKIKKIPLNELITPLDLYRGRISWALENALDVSEIFIHASDFAMAYNKLK